MLAAPESEEFEIVTLLSGVRSLRSRANGETFHPVVGPMAEAVGLHVRQQRLVERAEMTAGPFVIWDVGLGAAANAVAGLEAFAGRAAGAPIELHSIDRTTAPLAFALDHAATLEYLAAHAMAARQLLAHHAWTARASGLHWHFHPGDLRATMETAPAPHAILYDPYSPATNPDLWTLEHFTALRSRLVPARPCLLTNYTRSTAVRVTLLLAGFFVGCGHATGEKDQTTVASNTLDLLDEPLDAAWLRRVERSTRSGPHRTHGGEQRISAVDMERLRQHPQFGAHGGTHSGAFSDPV
jgi:tRNA U34 5-methylaminomethyl-2-thiouridine-forming methyltransferase MnmC